MAHFQRRHYVAVADVLARLADRRKGDLFGRAELAETVDEFTDLFRQDNARFKPSRFRARVWRDGTE